MTGRTDGGQSRRTTDLDVGKENSYIMDKTPSHILSDLNQHHVVQSYTVIIQDIPTSSA